MTPLAKATLTAEYSSGSLEIFDVQYNPTEFSLDKLHCCKDRPLRAASTE